MKIALLGYGKMGKEIEKISKERGHCIIFKIDKDSDIKNIKGADVAINFSTPDSAVKNIELGLNSLVPVISGTTGWLSDFKRVKELSKKLKTSFLYSSNFSLGVNLFFDLNKKLANIMKEHDEYKLNIEETHHIKKIDNPSGTAISLAEGIIKSGKYEGWTLYEEKDKVISIKSNRINEVHGVHKVNYSSAIDSIEIIHTAKNRKGFALGAIISAEWIINKKGIFEMKDVINDTKFKL